MNFSRLRIRDDRTHNLSSWTAENYSKSACNSTAQWSQFNQGEIVRRFGKYRNMDDVVVPGFHKKSSQGSVFMNPMRSSEYEFIRSYGGHAGEVQEKIDTCSPPYNYKKRWRFNLLQGSLVDLLYDASPVIDQNGRLFMPSSVISSDDTGRAIAEATTQCLSNRGRSQNNLWETLAEADKAAGTIPGIVKSGFKTLSRNKRIFDNAKAAGNAWLAWRYGLSPIMQDIAAVVDGIAKKVGNQRVTARGYTSVTGSLNSVTHGFSAFGSYTYSRTSTTVETLSVRVMSLDEYYVSLLHNIGFTYKGLVTLPWELLPYSFVVDWFANVGDFFGALVPDPTLRQLGTCVVIERSQSVVVSTGNYSPISTVTFVSAPSDSGCEVLYRSKSRAPGIGGPSLNIRGDFRLTNAKRAADAISLITQKIR